MGNNSVPKFIFRLSRFPVYRVSVLGRFYCSLKRPHSLVLPSMNSPVLSNAVSTTTPCAIILHRSYISCVLRTSVQLPDELKHLRGEARSVICPPLRWCEHPWSSTFPPSINGATLIRELWNTRNRVPETLWPGVFRWRYQDIHPGPVSVTLGVTISGSVCRGE